ncbi:hypothetical protein ACSBPH_08410 [Microbacterium sp. F51-2R]|uniref:hypothetical protein n=1 Tax=Microbacterium sp. F51-2R TaxID=3445777 RepID=UPI003F9F5BF5
MLSLLSLLPAVAGVILFEISFLALIVHVPQNVVLAGAYASWILAAPALIVESTYSTASGKVSARVRGWVLRPTFYACAIGAGFLAGAATYFAYVWAASMWGQLGTYVQLVGILLGMALVTAVGAIALTFGVDLVRSTLRRVRAWNRPILEGWTQDELREAIEPRLKLGRWPDPQAVDLRDEALVYLASAAREQQSRAILFGQILLLVGGALISGAVVPFVLNIVSFMDAAFTQIGTFPPDMSDAALEPGTFGALTFLAISLAIGCTGAYLVLGGAGRSARLAEFYERELQGRARPVANVSSASRWRRLVAPIQWLFGASTNVAPLHNPQSSPALTKVDANGGRP